MKHTAIRMLTTCILTVTFFVTSEPHLSAESTESQYLSQEYYVLFSNLGKLYALAIDGSSPIEIGPDTVVPPHYLVSSPNRSREYQFGIGESDLSPGYSYLGGVKSPRTGEVVYAEAMCGDGECRSAFNIWLVGSPETGQQRRHLFDQSTMPHGLLPIPLAWGVDDSTVMFEAHDLLNDDPFAGIWSYDLVTEEIQRVNLDGDRYNGQLWLSPNESIVLTTGDASRVAHSNSSISMKGTPTTEIKIIDLTEGRVRILLENSNEQEYFVRGWISQDSVSKIASVARQQGSNAAPNDVPPASSGFQRPMTNDHYGYQWLEYANSVYHPGDDYNGPGSGNSDCGTSISSVAIGVVRYVNTGSWGGMVIEHNWQGTTVYSQYGHIADAYVSVGQVVDKGQAVAAMGNVGTTYCHLHWEIRESDHPNPTYGAYWTTSVLSQQPNVENYYEDPEWWGDNHGPYANSGNDTILWDFDPNSAGWSASGMEWQGFGYGTWIMDPAQGGDPWIVKDDLYYDNTQYWGVEIRMSSLADQGDNIFWKTTNEPFYSGDKSIPLSVSPDGTTRTITIRTNDHPKWMHFISGLRIDPAYDGRPGTAGSNDDNILIDWVKLLNDPECPTVSITSPAEGSYFNGNAAISATASDGGGGETPSGVNRIEWDVFYDDAWNHYSSISPNPDTSPPYDATFAIPAGLSDQRVTIVAMAWDNQGNHCMENRFYRSVYIDRTAPTNPTAASPGCTATNNVWQNTCSDANFTWSGAADAGSGVAGYYYYWGTSSSGDPATWTTSSGYNPGAITSGSTYYLRVKTKDNAGNISSSTTLFVLKY
ncbi:MAG: peptidoglycan DD-metalloendopeptidase family protein, partial [Anaerolineae bacterium]